MKKNNGITLIALVVTVILLLILTSVSINLIIGENGLLKRAESTEEKQRELQARQELDLALLDAKKDKTANDNFNNNEYLDMFLRNKGITVSGDTAIVDGFAFLIDRDELKILSKLDDTDIEIEIPINTIITTQVQAYLGKNDSDKYEATVLVKFENEEGFQNIVITNPDGTTVEITEEEAIAGKTLTMELDEKYGVKITTKTGTIENTKITESSIEIIHNVEELVALRTKVNSGLTYEGKIVLLAGDLDLSSVCGQDVGNWIPIGNSTNQFKGTFDGQNYTISNLYYYATYGGSGTTYSYIGLFGYVDNGTLKNLTLNGSVSTLLSSGNPRVYTGGFGGYFTSSTLENLTNNTTVYSAVTTYGTVGGIAGGISGTVKNCTNTARISGNAYYIGGIAGRFGSGTYEYCVNTAEIYDTSAACIGGIVGISNGNIKKCYNTGRIYSQKGSVGGIAGGSEYNITECYNTGTVQGYSTSTSATGLSVGGICRKST